MRRWKLVALAAVLTLGCAGPIAAQTPDPLDSLRRQLQVLRTKKEYTQKEVERLLATTPPSPYRCPTGELWPAFEEGAPHTAATVLVLLDLFQQQRDYWKRYHLLTALSREREPSLRSFWLQLLADPKLPADYRWSVVMGLGKTGTDDDLVRLAQRLGSGHEWDAPLLWVLYERPQQGARASVLARFRDKSVPGFTRASGLRALGRLGGPELAGYLQEAAGDADETVRGQAAELLKRSQPPPNPDLQETGVPPGAC